MLKLIVNADDFGISRSINDGILEAYWDAYETIGLNVYTGLTYLQEVWQYHQQMVDAICIKDYQLGFRKLLDHTDLIYHRPTH